MSSISIKIDPSDPRDGSSPLQSPLSLREPNIKREAFIPVALAQEKFLALQAHLHDAVIRQQRAETELLNSQQRHAHELQASKQSFEAAFHELQARAQQRDTASRTLLQSLNEEAQKQRRLALSSIADLESRIHSMQVEHQTALDQTRASHAREMDQALAMQGAALKSASTGEPTLAAPVEMNKFPGIAAVISNKSSAETTEIEEKNRALTEELNRIKTQHALELSNLRRELSRLKQTASTPAPTDTPSLNASPLQTAPVSQSDQSPLLEAAQQQVNDAQLQLEQAQRQVQSQRVEIDSLRAALASTQTTLSDMVAEGADQALQHRLTELDSQLATAASNLAAERVAKDQTESQLSQARALHKQLEQQLQSLKADLEAARKQLAAQAAQAAKVAPVAQTPSVDDDIDAPLVKTSAPAVAVAAVAPATQTASSTNGAANAELVQQHEALQTELRLMRNQLQAEQNRARDADSKVEEMRAMNDALQAKINSEQQRRQSESSAIEQSASQATSAAQAKAVELQNELNAARQAANAESTALQQKLDDANRRAEQDREAAKAQFTTLEAELQAAKQRASHAADGAQKAADEQRVLAQQARQQAEEAAQLAVEARQIAKESEDKATQASARAAEADKRANDFESKLSKALQDAAHAKEQAETAETALREEQIIRKKLRNEIEDMKGKVRVYCRVRPPMGGEIERKDEMCVTFPDIFTIRVDRKDRDKISNFEFDSVFSPAHHPTQEDVFEETKGLAESSWNGFNVCIFAYGQTGSGKTWTMAGNASNPGLKPRFVHEVFRIVDEAKRRGTHEVVVSSYMLEIYKDVLYDLYYRAEHPDWKKGKPPAIEPRKDENGIVQFVNASVPTFSDANSMLTFMDKAEKTRAVASTDMNAGSSRSHLIMAIVLRKTEIVHGNEAPKVTTGKLSLVDLAGSESVKKTNAGKERLQEALSINKSLSALSNVMSILAEPGSHAHVPYRSNILTRSMEDSLGNNAKTLMFVNVSPSAYNAEETHNSLTYAALAKKITNKASADVTTTSVLRVRQRMQVLQRLLMENGIALPSFNDQGEVEADLPVTVEPQEDEPIDE